ncbi:hypothetical protein BKA62DRAFT_675705 [Auriculariales sp. MPI-PUGE-AT-0066]|nr:hypothetical protein BKA62DRAFT_675705 [Auriculariales sp. MPI-PUGE-AT-0066]
MSSTFSTSTENAVRADAVTAYRLAAQLTQSGVLPPFTILQVQNLRSSIGRLHWVAYDAEWTSTSGIVSVFQLSTPDTAVVVYNFHASKPPSEIIGILTDSTVTKIISRQIKGINSQQLEWTTDDSQIQSAVFERLTLRNSARLALSQLTDKESSEISKFASMDHDARRGKRRKTGKPGYKTISTDWRIFQPREAVRFPDGIDITGLLDYLPNDVREELLSPSYSHSHVDEIDSSNSPCSMSYLVLPQLFPDLDEPLLCLSTIPRSSATLPVTFDCGRYCPAWVLASFATHRGELTTESLANEFCGGCERWRHGFLHATLTRASIEAGIALVETCALEKDFSQYTERRRYQRPTISRRRLLHRVKSRMTAGRGASCGARVARSKYVRGAAWSRSLGVWCGMQSSVSRSATMLTVVFLRAHIGVSLDRTNDVDDKQIEADVEKPAQGRVEPRETRRQAEGDPRGDCIHGEGGGVLSKSDKDSSESDPVRDSKSNLPRAKTAESSFAIDIDDVELKDERREGEGEGDDDRDGDASVADDQIFSSDTVMLCFKLARTGVEGGRAPSEQVLIAGICGEGSDGVRVGMGVGLPGVVGLCGVVRAEREIPSGGWDSLGLRSSVVSVEEQDTRTELRLSGRSSANCRRSEVESGGRLRGMKVTRITGTACMSSGYTERTREWSTDHVQYTDRWIGRYRVAPVLLSPYSSSVGAVFLTIAPAAQRTVSVRTLRAIGVYHLWEDQMMAAEWNILTAYAPQHLEVEYLPRNRGERRAVVPQLGLTILRDIKHDFELTITRDTETTVSALELLAGETGVALRRTIRWNTELTKGRFVELWSHLDVIKLKNMHLKDYTKFPMTLGQLGVTSLPALKEFSLHLKGRVNCSQWLADCNLEVTHATRFPTVIRLQLQDPWAQKSATGSELEELLNLHRGPQQ